MHDVDLAMEILLDDLHPTLWNSQYKREVLRFLRKRGKDIPSKAFSRLVKAILAGPPRNQYRQDLTAAEWANIRDHRIRLRLLKLQESGAKLPKSAKRVYDRIQRDFPWQPNGNRSEEFSFFMTSGWVEPEASGTIEDFAAMSVESFVQWAETQTGRPWECGDGWHSFVANEPKLALKLLVKAAEAGAWPLSTWYMLLSQYQKTESVPKNIERQTAKSLADMPPEILARMDLQAARWLEQVRKALPKALRQNLWRRIWDASLMGPKPQGDIDFDMTLNHAGGLLGSVLYNEMAEYIPRVGPEDHPGLPRQLYSDFRKIADDENPSAKLARVRMAPMLLFLHRIDPEWTARALLSRMDPDNRETFDPHLWEGYLWHARWSDDLLLVIKELFFKVLRKLDCVPERIRDHGPQLFIQMAIPPNRGIDTDEAKAVLFNLGPGGLADAAVALRQMLLGAGDKSRTLWRDTVCPWFVAAWPKRSQDKSDQVSEKLAWMAIDAGDAFPDIIPVIEDLITPEEWGSTLFHLWKKEEEYHLVSRFPDAALTLTDKLVGDETRFTDDLKRLLDTISGENRSLRKTDRFRRLASRTE